VPHQRVDIISEGLTKIGRAYCRHCDMDHWVDIRKYNDFIILKFDEITRGNFLFERIKDSKRFFKIKELRKNVNAVYLDFAQLKELYNLLADFNSTEEYDKEYYDSLILNNKNESIVLFSTKEMFLSIDVIRNDKITYVFSVDIGWKLEDYKVRNLIKDLKRYIINNYNNPFFNYEALLELEEEKKLLSAIKYLIDLKCVDNTNSRFYKDKMVYRILE